MVDESLADLKAAQAEFGADDDLDEDDEDDEACEAKAWKDAEAQANAEQRVTDESGKTNPEVGPVDPPRENVAEEQPKPDCSAEPNNSDLIDPDELDE